jgi:hypothetical protein
MYKRALQELNEGALGWNLNGSHKTLNFYHVFLFAIIVLLIIMPT